MVPAIYSARSASSAGSPMRSGGRFRDSAGRAGRRVRTIKTPTACPVATTSASNCPKIANASRRTAARTRQRRDHMSRDDAALSMPRKGVATRRRRPQNKRGHNSHQLQGTNPRCSHACSVPASRSPRAGAACARAGPCARWPLPAIRRTERPLWRNNRRRLASSTAAQGQRARTPALWLRRKTLTRGLRIESTCAVRSGGHIKVRGVGDGAPRLLRPATPPRATS